MEYKDANKRRNPKRDTRFTIYDTHGVTLMDTLVGTALMLVIFLGIAAAFQLSVDVVTSNKGRAGAVALLNERMEYMKSLTYSALGTVGGIPSGALAQNESITVNGISYNRRTLIAYYDDTKDGSGGGDSNGISADSKTVKVEVSWLSRSGTRKVLAAARIAPTTGLESTVTGGTLTINAVDSAGGALSGATVSVLNTSTSVNLTTYANASGTVKLIGTPAGSGYEITVTKSGYSTARTYTATAQNTSPNPSHVTVSNNVTTSSTFAIDLLGTKTVQSFTPITRATTTDPFSGTSMIATSSNLAVSGGAAQVQGPAPYTSALLRSTEILRSYLVRYKTLQWSATTPASTGVRLQIYDGSGQALIPDTQLPGNAAGFTSSPVDLSGISTTTYPAISVFATLTGSSSATPSLDSWQVSYDYGPIPLPNIAFTLTGAKTIGSGPSGAIAKYSEAHNTGASASVTIPSLEWDNYTITVSPATSYAISSACSPQPETLAPGASATSQIHLSPHTTHSLLVDVRSGTSSALLSNASVRLTRTGYSSTVATDTCGQSFFSSLSNATYSIQVTLPGYTTYTGTNAVTVNGVTRFSVILN